MERTSREHTKFSKINTKDETYQMRIYKDDTAQTFCFSEITIGLSPSNPKMALSDYFSSISCTFGEEIRLEEMLPSLHADLHFHAVYEKDVDLNLLVWQLLSSNQDSRSLCVNILRMSNTLSLGNAYIQDGIYTYAQNTELHTYDDVMNGIRLIGRLAKIVIKGETKSDDVKLSQQHLLYYFFGKPFRIFTLNWDNKSLQPNTHGYSTEECALDNYIRTKVDLFSAIIKNDLVYGGNYYLVYQVLLYYYIVTNGRYTTGFNIRKDSIRSYTIPNDSPEKCNVSPRKPNLAMMFIRAIFVSIFIRDFSPVKTTPCYLNRLEIEDPSHSACQVSDGGLRVENNISKTILPEPTNSQISLNLFNDKSNN
jgi:hypothetical protein